MEHDPIIHVTRHAIDRMRSRCPEVADSHDLHVKYTIRTMWRGGIDSTKQGVKYLRDASHPVSGRRLVIVWKKLPDRPGEVFVVTVLTRRQAIKSRTRRRRRRAA